MKNVNNAVNLTGKMATDTFAVSFTATKGAKFIFSKIGTVPERQTFSELYDTHSGTDPLCLKSVLVSVQVSFLILFVRNILTIEKNKETCTST